MSAWVAVAADLRDLNPPSPGSWDWEFARDITPFLLRGLWVTVQATALGILVAMLLGLLLAVARRSRSRAASWPAGALVEFVRSTPLLVQLFFFFFYAFPEVTGISLSPLATGILALALHYGTYCSESYRAGIDSVPRGQWEAATAVNLPVVSTWWAVILPQSVRTVIPALGNLAVAMLKDAPLLSSIAVLELMAQAKSVQAVWFRGMEPFTLAGVLFLAVSLPAAIGVRLLERRYAYERE